MNNQTQALKNGLKTDARTGLLIAIGNNPIQANLNLKKYFGTIKNNDDIDGIADAVVDGLSSLPEVSANEALNNFLSFPIVYNNLTEVGKDWIAEEIVQNKTLKSSEGDEDDNEEDPNWGTVLGAAIPGMIGLLLTKPWQNKPANDYIPSSGVSNNPLIITGIAAVALIVLAVVFLGKQN